MGTAQTVGRRSFQLTSPKRSGVNSQAFILLATPPILVRYGAVSRTRNFLSEDAVRPDAASGVTGGGLSTCPVPGLTASQRTMGTQAAVARLNPEDSRLASSSHGHVGPTTSFSSFTTDRPTPTFNRVHDHLRHYWGSSPLSLYSGDWPERSTAL